MNRNPSPRDEGFTLIELMVAVSLMLVVGALSLGALLDYRKAQGQQQAADSLLSDLRKAGQQAVAEGRTYCVHVNDGTDAWTTLRGNCLTGTVVDPTTTATSPAALGSLSIATPASAQCPSAGACIYFYPRGTATQSSLAVTRSGAPSITVTVEGLTGRVDRS